MAATLHGETLTIEKNDLLGEWEGEWESPTTNKGGFAKIYIEKPDSAVVVQETSDGRYGDRYDGVLTIKNNKVFIDATSGQYNQVRYYELILVKENGNLILRGDYTFHGTGRKSGGGTFIVQKKK